MDDELVTQGESAMSTANWRINMTGFSPPQLSKKPRLISRIFARSKGINLFVLINPFFLFFLKKNDDGLIRSFIY